MNMHNFSIQDALRFGWAMTKEKFFLLVSLLILTMIVSSLSDVSKSENLFTMLINAAAFVLSFVISAGTVGILLKLYSGKEATFMNVFDQYAITFRYFVAYLLYILVIILIPLIYVAMLIFRFHSNSVDAYWLMGLAIVFLPGIYGSVRFQFYNYFIVDKHVGIVESFRESARITDGHFWKLMGFWVVLIGINILGMLLFFIGLFVSLPVSMLALAYAYKKLSEPPVSEDEIEEEISVSETTTDSNRIGGTEEPEGISPVAALSKKNLGND